VALGAAAIILCNFWLRPVPRKIQAWSMRSAHV
jgi:hypothetical protein